MSKFKLSDISKLTGMVNRNTATKELAELVNRKNVQMRAVEIDTPDGVVVFSDVQAGARARMTPELAGQGLELVRASVAAELSRQEQEFADMGVDITA